MFQTCVLGLRIRHAKLFAPRLDSKLLRSRHVLQSSGACSSQNESMTPPQANLLILYTGTTRHAKLAKQADKLFYQISSEFGHVLAQSMFALLAS